MARQRNRSPNERKREFFRRTDKIEAIKLSDREFKVMIKRILSNNRVMITSKKDIETIKKDKSEIKNAISEINNTVEGINSSLDEAEDQISVLEDKVEKCNQAEQQKEKRI